MNTEIAVVKKSFPALKKENKKMQLHFWEDNTVFAKMQEEIATLQEQYINLLEVNSRLRKIIAEQYSGGEDTKLLKENEGEKLPVRVAPAETALAMPEEVKPKILHHFALMELVKKTKRGNKQQQPTLEGKTKIIELLYKNEFGMRPAELFSACGLRKVTGSKHVNFLQHRGLVSFGGNNWTGRYYLTTKGKKFAEGEEVELSINKYRYRYNSGALNKPRE